MIKKSFLILPALLLCLGVAGCKKDTSNNESDGEIIPCVGLQSEKIIEIKNLKTKLVIAFPEPTGMPFFYTDGIVYYVKSKDVMLYFYYKDNYFICDDNVCNIPDYAINWVSEYIQDGLKEIDVVINGKVYVSVEYPPFEDFPFRQIYGTFEFTSLKKQNN
jgi:hypothetical protein